MIPVRTILFTICLSLALTSARRPLFRDISARDEWLEELYLRDIDAGLDPRDAWLDELDSRGMFKDDLHVRQVGGGGQQGPLGGSSSGVPNTKQPQGSTDYPGKCEKQKGGESRCSCNPPGVLGDVCPSESQDCSCKALKTTCKQGMEACRGDGCTGQRLSYSCPCITPTILPDSCTGDGQPCYCALPSQGGQKPKDDMKKKADPKAKGVSALGGTN